MRELKFRAWLDEYNHYIYFGGDYKEPTGRFGKGRCALVGNNHIADLIINEDNTTKFFNVNKVECIEQYTGLKDKNGKEIYEGDIVIDIYDKEFYEVEFDLDRAGFIPFACGDGCGCCESYVINDSEDVKIVGNIHENPELLKGGKNGR